MHPVFFSDSCSFEESHGFALFKNCIFRWARSLACSQKSYRSSAINYVCGNVVCQRIENVSGTLHFWSVPVRTELELCFVKTNSVLVLPSAILSFPGAQFPSSTITSWKSPHFSRSSSLDLFISGRTILLLFSSPRHSWRSLVSLEHPLTFASCFSAATLVYFESRHPNGHFQSDVVALAISPTYSQTLCQVEPFRPTTSTCVMIYSQIDVCSFKTVLH